MPSAPPPTPAGWYPDPDLANTQRYYDGSSWTEHVAPVAATPAPKSTNDPLVTVGIISALVFPLLGLILGLVVVGKSVANGVAIMLLSVVAGAVYYLVLFA